MLRLLHPTEIAFQPVERLLEKKRERDSVAGYQQDLTLVRQWRAEQTKKRLLTIAAALLSCLLRTAVRASFE
jgi:hypothetical protein